MRHQPTLPSDCLEMLETWPRFLESRLLMEAMALYQRSKSAFQSQFELKDLYGLLTDSLRMGEQLEIASARALVLECSSLEQLRRLHDRWAARLQRAPGRYGAKISSDHPKKRRRAFVPEPEEAEQLQIRSCCRL